MEKDVIIYIVSVVISVLVFYIIAKKKSDALKSKKEKLQIENETTKNLTFIFHQILKNR